ncbi:MAG: alkaline phosphatase family protein [Candidatus Bathyarchaeota archaeon]|nr:alkaline phosphatase family protein [Candidatus Bathyarchaeota archaeon]
MKHLIIIGLDGVPYSLLRNLSEKDIMPNTKSIIKNGIFRQMESSIPEVSSVAWSSLITGKNPGEHGIFGFTDLSPHTYNYEFPNFNSLRKPPFWEKIEEKSVIINVPNTYPVKEMNGVHISGFVSVDLEKSVHPKSLISKLKELDYRLDVDSQKAHKSLELFLYDLDKTLKARIQAYQYLWDSQDWKVFMLAFTGTDRLMHFLWNSYEDEQHKYHRDFLEHFRKIDEILGDISAKMNEEDLLIVLSDHGFERLDKDVHISYLLKREGFLKFEDDDEPTLTNMDCSTKAFVLDPARIYINLRGKYPCGSVDVQNKEKILKDLEALFNSLEIDNEKAIRDVYRKEEIYSGPFLEQAPDLILVGNQGSNLKANIKANKLIDKPIFTGKHTQNDAFLLIRGFVNRNIIPDSPTIYEVEQIIMELEKRGTIADKLASAKHIGNPCDKRV